MGADRPDCLLAIKEACMHRIGKYLKNNPRLVWKFDFQDAQDEINIFTDADWAGCRRSRKSTSGGTIMIGTHCIKAWAKTQAVIAKSSAESELYAVVRGAREGLGLKTFIKDLG